MDNGVLILIFFVVMIGCIIATGLMSGKVDDVKKELENNQKELDSAETEIERLKKELLQKEADTLIEKVAKSKVDSEIKQRIEQIKSNEPVFEQVIGETIYSTQYSVKLLEVDRPGMFVNKIGLYKSQDGKLFLVHQYSRSNIESCAEHSCIVKQIKYTEDYLDKYNDRQTVRYNKTHNIAYSIYTTENVVKSFVKEHGSVKMYETYYM